MARTRQTFISLTGKSAWVVQAGTGTCSQQDLRLQHYLCSTIPYVWLLLVQDGCFISKHHVHTIKEREIILLLAIKTHPWNFYTHTPVYILLSGPKSCDSPNHKGSWETVFILGGHEPSWTSKRSIAMEEREKRHWETAGSICNILQGIIALGVCFQATPPLSSHRNWFV